MISSPVCSLFVAYIYVLFVSVILFNFGFYKNNSYFNFGPPITIFNNTIESTKTFYVIHGAIFIHQIINNWINTIVYPWIINDVQNSKTTTTRYSKYTSLLLINLFNLYSQIDTMFIIVGLSSQISFLFTMTVANVISSTILNIQYLNAKRNDNEYLNMV